MQIAFIGNINNAPFLLAEALREIGVNVRLLLTRAERLHHPVLSGLTNELPDWVYDASSLGLDAFERQDSSIGAALGWVMHKADLAVLNDTGPSLHNLLPVPIVSVLTGSDLTYYAALSSGKARRASWAPGFISTPQGLMAVSEWEEMVIRQRVGIRRSLLVSYSSWRGAMPKSDALLDEIGVEPDRRICLPFIDTTRLHPSPLPGGQPLKIFNGARLNWVEPMPDGFSDQDHKGTDVLLRGFARFLQGGGQGSLTLAEKGLHVAETRALARDLGLDPHIVWKQEMSLSDFFSEIAAAHVVCCSLGKSIPGQAGLCGMAAGRPVIADFQHYAPHYPEPWPACDARSEDQVAEHLWTLYRRPESRAEIGKKAERFAQKHLSPAGAARTFMAQLSEVSALAVAEARIKRLESAD